MTNRFVAKEIFNQVFATHLSDELIKLSYDTRLDIEKSVFFAFFGEDFDGHDFVEIALKKGAIFAVVDSSRKEKLSHLPKEKLIFVNNPLAYYSDLAALHLQTITIPKIAITGSNGKTTTKNIFATMLKHIFGEEYVYKTPGNKNNHIGIPISALEVNQKHKIAVFEIGMNHEGELTHLCKIIKPNYGVITCIANAHEGNFADGIEGIQRAKGELFKALDNTGSAVINIDDNRVVKEAEKNKFIKTVTVTFIKEKKADLVLLKNEPFCFDKGTQKICVLVNNEEFNFEIPLIGEHNAKNTLLALGLIHLLDLPIQKAIDGLKKLELEKSRMQYIKLKQNIVMIDDSYNANPSSFSAGIASLAHASDRRKIAAVGSMGELGESSTIHHEYLGGLLANNFHQLFLCGPMANVVAEGAQKAGLKKENIFIAHSSDDLCKPIKEYLQPDDLLYLKASNSNKMWIIADYLVKENGNVL